MYWSVSESRIGNNRIALYCHFTLTHLQQNLGAFSFCFRIILEKNTATYTHPVAE